MEKTNYEEFYKEIKNLVRNTGRSSIISVQEIEELLVKYGKIE